MDSLHRIKIEDALDKIAMHVGLEGGRALLVGGAVRDMLMTYATRPKTKDYDVEVFGLTPEKLKRILSQQLEVDLVGESFGVLKIKGLPIDVSIPRRESKRGLGHKGFDIYSDPFMTLEEAVERRDFTINAIYYDLSTHEFIDPTGKGIEDLNGGRLRPVSAKFSEDPLRVLRGVQFAARFCLKPTEEFLAAAKDLTMENLPKERIFEEWKKLILQGRLISKGLKILRLTGWDWFFPELVCKNTDRFQDRMDDFAYHRQLRSDGEHEALIIGFTCLCLDFDSEKETRSFMERLTNQKRLIDDVVQLWRNQFVPELWYTELQSEQQRKTGIRRKACELPIRRLCRLIYVVNSKSDLADRLYREAAELGVLDGPLKPLLTGKLLLEHGYKSGVMMGHLLDSAYEAQISSSFDTVEEGLKFLRSGSI